MKILPNLSTRWKVKILDKDMPDGLLVLSNLTKKRAIYLVELWNDISKTTIYYVDER